MITDVSVDGFRSLEKFRLRLEPGLNILIGPNGSGKSNILTFFAFVSELMSQSISDALSRTGGAGAIFNKKSSENFNRQIKCSIRGAVNAKKEERERFGVEKAGGVYYKYDFVIEASPQFDSVYFISQNFYMKKRENLITKNILRKRISDNDWDIAVAQTYSPETSQKQILLNKFNIDDFDVRYSPISGAKTAKNIEEITKRLHSIFVENSAFSDSLIRQLYPIVNEIYFVLSDLGGTQILNIVPSEVKKPEDSAAEPGIRPDGSGLAATLRQLKQSALTATPNRFARLRLNFPRMTQSDAKRIYAQIQELATLVNPAVSAFDVFNDPFDNVLKVRVTVASGESEAILPLSAMSDGTIKWLSLVTAILTYKNIFAIEEPENFLHPRMQQEIVSIMRADAETRSEFSFVLMTTHSESLLNAANPLEAIVVSFRNGRTRAMRPKDAQLLSTEIEKSGFGLGHFYISGALHDA